MKIAIDVRSLMEGRHSGVEEYTTQIITALVAVAPQHKYHLFYNSAQAVNMPRLGTQSYQAFHYPNKLFNLAQNLVGRPAWDRMLAPVIGQVDLFFVPNPRLLPIASGVPLVVTAHDLSYERFPEFYSMKRQLWHRMMKPRRLMQAARHIIAVSSATKEDIISLYDIPENKISVVHSGIHNSPGKGEGGLPAIALRPSVALREGGLATAGGFADASNGSDHILQNIYKLPPKYILYLGVLEPRKNVVSIIEAFSAIAKNIPQDLVLAGERGWLEKTVFRAIAASPVKNRIHYLGKVSEAEKWPLYAGADLFVYPSFYEGFGFPPLEALISGTPVITSRSSSLPEIVGEWATMINPYDVAELALVMQELLKKPERLPLVERELIKAQYSWETAARKTIDIFENIT